MPGPDAVIQLDSPAGPPAYRAIRFDAEGGVASTEIVEAGTDDEALTLVRAMAHRFGIDLWDHGRLVASFAPSDREDGQAPPATG